MRPLPLDERRVLRLVEAAEAIEDGPRGPGYRQRVTDAYSALARACNTMSDNAKGAAS